MCLISNADVIDKIGWDSSPLNKFFEHTNIILKLPTWFLE